MTGFWRIVTAIRHVVLPAVVFVLMGMALSACDSFKRAIGIERTSPDEFAVESRAPLTIPPDFALRPPAPGAGRPQEVSSADKAQTLLNNAGPGQPGKQEAGALHYPGAAQIDPNSQIPDQSLSAKLLQTQDSGDSIVVEKHETTVLEGVH
jgi:hypothetical protein